MIVLDTNKFSLKNLITEKYFCRNLEEANSFIKRLFKNWDKLKLGEQKSKDTSKVKLKENLMSQSCMHSNIQTIFNNKKKRNLLKSPFLKCKKVKLWSIYTVKKIDQLLKLQERVCMKNSSKHRTKETKIKSKRSKNLNRYFNKNVKKLRRLTKEKRKILSHWLKLWKNPDLNFNK